LDIRNNILIFAPYQKPKAMMSQPNNELEAQFLKAFRLAVKMREAEEKQRPFYGVGYKNEKGEIHHVVRMCNN
jgi:hypothetical protein